MNDNERFSLSGAAHDLSARASQLESALVSEKRVGLSRGLAPMIMGV
jgi:hypothetical protein